MTYEKVVVFETGGGAKRNNTFDRKAAGNCRYAWPACYLYEQCLARGIHLMTPDLYFEMDPKPKQALYVRGSIETEEKKIIARGAHPAILRVYETPLYAVRFFFNLKNESAKYDHAFLPEGARPLVSPKSAFHGSVAANPYGAEDLAVNDFNKRKYLTLVNSNTRIKPLKRWYLAARNAITPLPNFIDRELYIDRLEAIQYFSRYDDFDLYGYGWDKPVRYSRGVYDPAIRKSYRGTVDDKFKLLQNYKFAICFENSIFGGYISEKIIDAMVAGCVPVYWGAPDVAQYIPENAFIDMRKFKNFTELDYYLRQVDTRMYNQYIRAIDAFLRSNQYYYFSQEKYATDFITVFESYF